jgi:hypothetical protein
MRRLVGTDWTTGVAPIASSRAPAPSGTDDDGPCAVFDVRAAADRLRARGRWPRLLFRAPGLNRAMFVKVLRTDLAGAPPAATGTELRMPVDPAAPHGPALALPLDRPGMEAALATHAGLDRRRDVAGYACDMLLVARLTALPSFDPWLLRVRLGRIGVPPDPAYLAQPIRHLAAADEAVARHMAPAVAFALAVQVGDRAIAEDHAAAERMWRSAGAPALMPLGRRLGLDDAALPGALEGWEGTAYYAWRRTRAEEAWSALRAWLAETVRTAAGPRVRRGADAGEAAIRAHGAFDAAAARIDADLDRYAAAHAAMFAQGRDAGPMAAWLGEAAAAERRIGAGFVATGRVVGYWTRAAAAARTAADRGTVADRIARMLPPA